MRNSIILLSVLVMGLVLSIGCQTNPKFESYNEQVDENMGMFEKVPIYFWDRLLDLTDIVNVDLAFGEGNLLNVHATKYLQVGAGYRNGVCFGVMPRSFGMWQDDRIEGGLSLPLFVNLYYKNQNREALWGTTTLFDHDVSYKGADHLCNDTAHRADIGFSFHFFMIGADVGVSPFQVFDFVLGFFGMPFLVPVDPVGFGTEVDVANDDVRARHVRNDSDLNYYLHHTTPGESMTRDPQDR